MRALGGIFMKKFLSIVLVLIMSMCLFSSCKKKEPIVYSGSVMLYTTIDETVASALKQSFEKEYPGVVLDYYYGDVDRVNRKIDVEFESGQPNADVVFLSDIFSLENMKDKSRLEAYATAEAKKIPDQYKDLENYYYAASVTTMGIGFSKDSESGVDEKNAPKTWKDFLNNDYRGKMALANPSNDNYVKYWVMAMMQNPNYGDVYFRRLRDYGLVIKTRESDVIDNIVNNTYQIGICYDETSANYTKEYENFGFKYADSDNITMLNGVALVKDSVNPVNGKLLIDYILSKKGQEVLVANGLVSARTDVKNVLNTKSVIANSSQVDFDDIRKKGKDYMTTFNDIFGIK